MKKKIMLAFAMVLTFCFAMSFYANDQTANVKAATQSKLGKKVDWIDISTNKLFVLNGSYVSFNGKKKNKGILDGLDKGVVYYSVDVENKPSLLKSNHEFYEKNTVSFSKSVLYDEEEISKKVYALAVFYDKNKKPIAYQEKTLKTNKLIVKPNKEIKKITLVKTEENLKKGNNSYVSYDTTKIPYSYSSLHTSLKSISVNQALKESTLLRNGDKILKINPRWALPREDIQKPKKGKLYTLIIFYDKNLKPVSYTSQKYNHADF